MQVSRSNILAKMNYLRENKRPRLQKRFSEKEQDFVYQHTHYCPSHTTFNTRLMITQYSSQSTWPLCSICSVKLPHFRMFTFFSKSYTCSKICARKKAASTSIERYGVGHAMHRQLSQAKVIDTLFKRYGVTNPMRSKIFKAKQQQTMLYRHGVPTPLQSAAIRAKQQQTMIERYGIKYPVQLKYNKDVKKDQTKQFKKIKEAKNTKYPEVVKRLKQPSLALPIDPIDSSKLVLHENQSNVIADQLIEQVLHDNQ